MTKKKIAVLALALIACACKATEPEPEKKPSNKLRDRIQAAMEERADAS